jgi:NodT family efflux transporter outer membrane factor (OMF) lipoprotein
MLPGLVCAALAACSVGTPYHRPDIPLPAQWRAPASTTPPNQPAAMIWPAHDWWRSFGSSELNELIDTAERSNDDIAAAIARIQEADAQARIAGAPLLPTVDGGASVTRERAQVPGLGPRDGTLFSPLIYASYELDFWGKNRAARDAARAAAVASRYDRETIALTVVTSVAVSYFQALELRDRIQVAQQNLANAQRILEGLRMELSAGTATRLDVAQQESVVATLNAALPPLLLQFRQTVNALAVLVGKTPEQIDVERGTLTQIAWPEVQAGLPSELLTRRPDIAEAEENLIAANADITVARAQLFPSVELTASGGYESTALSTLTNPASRVWSVAAGLTQPIFHGGALQGQLSYSKARYTELLTTYHKTVITALSNVEDALVSVQQNAEQQQRQQVAVSTARRAYEFAQAQLQAGTVNVLTVLNTENTLFIAQDTLVQVQFAHLQSLVDLFNALGGGWSRT